MRTVTVIGAGGWGTALAVHLAGLGKQVRLWGRDEALISRMSDSRSNESYLPGIPFPESVHPTASLADATAGADCVVWAVPSHATRELLRSLAPLVQRETIVVSGTKGFELKTLNRMSEVMAQELGDEHPVAVLSGPSFAGELARGAPTAVLAASRWPAVAATLQEEFRSPSLRLYASEDVTGVEMGGGMKNVIAIAAGVVDGLNLGPNALAALVTRGLAEISRLACALGGRKETLAGLSGLGDLILTCTGGFSRNHHVGVELGRGRPLAEVLGAMHTVAEGVRTTEAALALGRRHDVDLPIVTQMSQVLAGEISAAAAVEELMLRRQRSEADAAAD